MNDPAVRIATPQLAPDNAGPSAPDAPRINLNERFGWYHMAYSTVNVVEGFHLPMAGAREVAHSILRLSAYPGALEALANRLLEYTEQEAEERLARLGARREEDA